MGGEEGKVTGREALSNSWGNYLRQGLENLVLLCLATLC